MKYFPIQTFLSENNVVTPVLPLAIPSEEFNGIIRVLSEELERIREEKSTMRTSRHLQQELETADVSEVPVEQNSDVESEMEDSDEGKEKSSNIRKTRTIEILKERIQVMLNWFNRDEIENPPIYRLRKPRFVCDQGKQLYRNN